MKANNFRTIDKTEIEDCEKACKKYGFNLSDFSLREHDVIETPRTDGLHHTNAKLTILRNKASKTYATGNGSRWAATFGDDLRKGVFGKSEN